MTVATTTHSAVQIIWHIEVILLYKVSVILRDLRHWAVQRVTTLAGCSLPDTAVTSIPTTAHNSLPGDNAIPTGDVKRFSKICHFLSAIRYCSVLRTLSLRYFLSGDRYLGGGATDRREILHIHQNACSRPSADMRCAGTIRQIPINVKKTFKKFDIFERVEMTHLKRQKLLC